MTNPYAPPQQSQQVLRAEDNTPRYLPTALIAMGLAVYGVPNVWFSLRIATWTVNLGWQFWIYTLLASVFAILVETRKSHTFQAWLPWALLPCCVATVPMLGAIISDFMNFVIAPQMLPPIIHGIAFTIVVWCYFYLAIRRVRWQFGGVENVTGKASQPLPAMPPEQLDP